MLIRDMVNELHREFSLRKQVFPKLIRVGRLTEGESLERLDRLQGAICVLTLLMKCRVQQFDDLQALLAQSHPVTTTPKGVSLPSHIKGGA